MKRYLQSVEEVVKALKEGKDIEIKPETGKIKMVDGIICFISATEIIINTIICFEKNKFYTEEPEQLKFEVNKLYKTSKNKKAFLYKIVKDADFMYYFSSEDGCFTTDENGVFYNFGLPTNNKIVGYWEEEK